MNLISSFNLLSAISPDITSMPRELKADTSNTNTDILVKGNIACNFGLTDDYIADATNTEVFTYEAGEACPFGVTTISYLTSPVKSTIDNGKNSNTFSLQTCYHLAAMKTDDIDGNAHCYENAFIKTSSTQYRDGSASFVINGGEVTIGPNDIKEWTTVKVNGGDNVDAPGFYYMEEGFAEGEVIFVTTYETKANYTSFEGKFIDLCKAIEDAGATSAPTPSSVFENTKDAIEKGNVECNFKLTDEYIADTNNAEVQKYEPGEACPFGITTVSYMTSPLSEYVTKTGSSNTYELEASYHLAVMRDLDGVTYCIDHAIVKSGSTQYHDGTASFSGTGGEHVFTSGSGIGDWTTVAINNGGSGLNGFYYMEDGLVEGQVIFNSDFDTQANFTRIQGTFIDLCKAIQDATPTPAPTQSSGYAKNVCEV